MESISVRSDRQSHAFSLAELMFVLVILALLMGLSVSSFHMVTGATQLTSAGDQLVNQIVEARQTAIQDSAHVEMRFYRPLGDGLEGGAWTVLPTRKLDDGTHVALANPFRIPLGIDVAESKVLSTLIGALEGKIDSDQLLNGNAKEEQRFTSFRFYPDGSTSLPLTSGGDTWHLTLIVNSQGEELEDRPPDNFYTIRIDPYTGAVRTFRP